MANYQILFNGEVSKQASVDAVRENLARELGLDERKAKQLFSGRTVVIRSQLDHQQAEAWQAKLAQFGAICRIKDLSPKGESVHYKEGKDAEQTLRDITAAHLECPRCGHMQLDSSHCARCGVDLEQAFKLKRKEDLLIEKKLRELRAKKEVSPAQAPRVAAQGHARPDFGSAQAGGDNAASKVKKGVLRWLNK